MKTKSEEQGERRQTQTEKGRKATGGYQPQTEGPRERTVAIREIRISVEEQMAKVKEELEKRDYECTPMKYTKGGWRLNREMVGHVIDASSKEKRATVRGQFTTYGGTGPGDFFPVQFDVTTEDPVIMEVIENICGKRTVTIREIKINAETQMRGVKSKLRKRGYEYAPMKDTTANWSRTYEVMGCIIDASSKEKRATVRGQFTTYGGTGPGDFFPVQFDVTTEDPVIMEVIEKVCGKKA